MAISLDELSEDLQRRLYDAFQHQVRYNKPRHEARIRITVREDTVRTFVKATSMASSHKRSSNRPAVPAAAESFPCCVSPAGGTHLIKENPRSTSTNAGRRGFGCVPPCYGEPDR